METKTFNVPATDVDTRGHSKSKYVTEYPFYVSIFGERSYVDCLRTTNCSYCSEFLGWELREGKFITKTECAFPNGVTYSMNLAVPSGKIVFRDSLGDFFTEPDDMVEGYIDYNSASGRKTYALLMAEQGVAYGAVLNTSPSVYQNTENNSLIVANLEIDDNEEKVLPFGWKHLGSITTDLWAYSVTDYSRYVTQGGDTEKSGLQVAEVPPGVYTFTHYADQADFISDTGDLTIFAEATYKASINIPE